MTKNFRPALLFLAALTCVPGAFADFALDRELAPAITFTIRSFEGSDSSGERCTISVLEQGMGEGYALTELSGLKGSAEAPFAITLEDNAHRIKPSNTLGINGVSMSGNTRWEAKAIGKDFGHPTAVRFTITKDPAGKNSKREIKCANLKLKLERRADREYVLHGDGTYTADPAGKELADWEAKTTPKQQRFCAAKAAGARIEFMEKSCANTPTKCAAIDDLGDEVGADRTLHTTYSECLKKLPHTASKAGKTPNGEAPAPYSGAVSAQ